MTGDTAPAGQGSALAALRERGADRLDPVRFRFIEALAQRASARQGAARRVLEDKLAGLLSAYEAGLVTPPSAPVEAAGRAVPPVDEPREVAPTPAIAATSVRPALPVQDAAPAPAARADTGLLGTLVHQLAERNAPPRAALHVDERSAAAPRTSVASPIAASAPPELKALSYFRSTWSRLSTEQRLAQSAAKLPENAGPLNSQHLVHQSLVLMRDLSPGYLERFIAHVDALMWLDQINSNGTK